MRAASKRDLPDRRLRARRVALGLTLAVVLIGTATAAAATPQEMVRVRAGQAVVYERMRTSSDVIATVPAGTLLEVLSRDADWLWVVLPPDSNGTRKVGYIQARLVEAVPPGQPGQGAAPPGAAAGAGRTAPPRAAGKGGWWTWSGRFFVRADAGYQTTATSFLDQTSFVVYREEATSATAYHISRGRLFDLTGGIRAGQRLCFGLGVSGFTRRDPAAVTGAIPHPFFFGQPRPIAGQAQGLEREEIRLHAEIGVRIPIVRRIDLTVFAGPSLFTIRQDVVTAIRFTEAYPYDTALFNGVSVERVSRSVLGYHAGLDLAYPIWRFLGVGLGARFSRADTRLPATAHGVRVRAGGIEAAGGVRIRF
jgi:hypothetical protein